jgi:hypothetical protein
MRIRTMFLLTCVLFKWCLVRLRNTEWRTSKQKKITEQQTELSENTRCLLEVLILSSFDSEQNSHLYINNEVERTLKGQVPIQSALMYNYRN